MKYAAFVLFLAANFVTYDKTPFIYFYCIGVTDRHTRGDMNQMRIMRNLSLPLPIMSD